MEKAKRIKILPGNTEKMATGCGTMYVTLNFFEGKPFEVFSTLGKSGGCAAAYSEALARSISLGLRHNIPIEEYIKQLSGIHCPNRALEDGEFILSCPDAISKILKQRMEEVNEQK
jgi:ribonucleoside-diphosphate reductase alpha chain